MKKSKKLSEVIRPAKVINLSHIKNYEKIQTIYDEYLQQNFFTVASNIKPYGEFRFFLDLLIYLRHKYRSEHHRHYVYDHFVELYYETLTI